MKIEEKNEMEFNLNCIAKKKSKWWFELAIEAIDGTDQLAYIFVHYHHCFCVILVNYKNVYIIIIIIIIAFA